MKRILLSLSVSVLLGVLPASAQVDFSRYVALGDSLTAGYVGGGLHRFYQENSYPALLARQAGASVFEMPLVSPPGLPPILGLVQLVPTPVILPIDDVPGFPLNAEYPLPYNNLGVPGASLADLLLTTGDIEDLIAGNTDNVMHDLILRRPTVPDPATGQPLAATALVQAIAQNPTFVTLWIGSNDILGAAIYGTPVEGVTMTPVDVFAQLYPQVVGALATMTNARMVILTLPPVTAIPFTTSVAPDVDVPGLGTVRLVGTNGPVSDDSLLTLNATAFIAQGWGLPIPGSPPLPDDLTVTATGIVPGVILRPDEIAAINDRVASFNQVIESTAAAFGIPVLDVPEMFRQVEENGRWLLGGIELSTDFLVGGIFSYDGVHPQNIGYAMVAVELIDLVNRTWGASIPQVDMSEVLCGGGCADQGVPTPIPTAKADFSWAVVESLMEAFPLLGNPRPRLVEQAPVLD